MTRIGRRFVPQSTIERRVQACDDRHAAALRAVTDTRGRIVAPPQSDPEPAPRHYESAPYAVFAFDWPELGGAMFNVVGGPMDCSTVTRETLTRLGIAVREEGR